MSAEPARQDQDHEQPTLLQRSAKIIRFPKRKQEQGEQEPSDKAQPKIHSKDQPQIPGDWASIIAIWQDSPDPLCAIVEQAKQARNEGTPQGAALAIWAIIMLPPRAALHLASWMLTHPLRFVAGVALLIIFIATL